MNPLQAFRDFAKALDWERRAYYRDMGVAQALADASRNFPAFFSAPGRAVVLPTFEDENYEPSA